MPYAPKRPCSWPGCGRLTDDGRCAEILRELKASGYYVSAKLMNAMWYGVLQSRQRMIFVGVREDLWN